MSLHLSNRKYQTLLYLLFIASLDFRFLQTMYRGVYCKIVHLIFLLPHQNLIKISFLKSKEKRSLFKINQFSACFNLTYQKCTRNVFLSIKMYFHYILVNKSALFFLLKKIVNHFKIY